MRVSGWTAAKAAAHLHFGGEGGEDGRCGGAGWTIVIWTSRQETIAVPSDWLEKHGSVKRACIKRHASVLFWLTKHEFVACARLLQAQHIVYTSEKTGHNSYCCHVVSHRACSDWGKTVRVTNVAPWYMGRGGLVLSQFITRDLIMNMVRFVYVEVYRGGIGKFQ